MFQAGRVEVGFHSPTPTNCKCPSAYWAEERACRSLTFALTANLVSEPRTFTRNRPVVIVPIDNPARIRELRDLAIPGASIVLAQDGVPIAEYAKEVLWNADVEYGENFEQRILGNIASREANVRASAKTHYAS